MLSLWPWALGLSLAPSPTPFALPCPGPSGLLVLGVEHLSVSKIGKCLWVAEGTPVEDGILSGLPASSRGCFQHCGQTSMSPCVWKGTGAVPTPILREPSLRTQLWSDTLLVTECTEDQGSRQRTNLARRDQAEGVH